LVRVSFREGKSAQYCRAVADEVHGALVEVASVPELDRFQVLTEHAPASQSTGIKESTGKAAIDSIHSCVESSH
jgi:Tautomerase enzyme